MESCVFVTHFVTKYRGRSGIHNDHDGGRTNKHTSVSSFYTLTRTHGDTFAFLPWRLHDQSLFGVIGTLFRPSLLCCIVRLFTTHCQLPTAVVVRTRYLFKSFVVVVIYHRKLRLFSLASLSLTLTTTTTTTTTTHENASFDMVRHGRRRFARLDNGKVVNGLRLVSRRQSEKESYLPNGRLGRGRTRPRRGFAWRCRRRCHFGGSFLVFGLG